MMHSDLFKMIHRDNISKTGHRYLIIFFLPGNNNWLVISTVIIPFSAKVILHNCIQNNIDIKYKKVVKNGKIVISICIKIHLLLYININLTDNNSKFSRMKCIDTLQSLVKRTILASK